MKKIITLFLAIILVFSLSSCKGDTDILSQRNKRKDSKSDVIAQLDDIMELLADNGITTSSSYQGDKLMRHYSLMSNTQLEHEDILEYNVKQDVTSRVHHEIIAKISNAKLFINRMDGFKETETQVIDNHRGSSIMTFESWVNEDYFYYKSVEGIDNDLYSVITEIRCIVSDADVVELEISISAVNTGLIPSNETSVIHYNTVTGYSYVTFNQVDDINDPKLFETKSYYSLSEYDFETDMVNTVSYFYATHEDGSKEITQFQKLFLDFNNQHVLRTFYAPMSKTTEVILLEEDTISFSHAAHYSVDANNGNYNPAKYYFLFSVKDLEEWDYLEFGKLYDQNGVLLDEADTNKPYGMQMYSQNLKLWFVEMGSDETITSQDYTNPLGRYTYDSVEYSKLSNLIDEATTMQNENYVENDILYINGEIMELLEEFPTNKYE